MAQKILVIDDEIDVLKVLKFRLEKAGYDVITALDGIKGLELAVHEHPDLVILDIMMPGGDGYAVCERLKHLSATATLPVIFLSAKTEDKDVLKGYASGAIFYLKKPYDPDVLLDTVKKALDRPQELEKQKGMKNLLMLSKDPILQRTVRDNFSATFKISFIQNKQGFKSLPEISDLDIIILDLSMEEIDFQELILEHQSRFKEQTLLIFIIDVSFSPFEAMASQIKCRYEYLRRPFEIDNLKLLLK